MPNVFTGLRKFFLRSSSTSDNSKTREGKELFCERTKQHPYFLEIWKNPNSDSRTRILLSSNFAAQEAAIPRGLRSFFLNVGSVSKVPELCLEWDVVGGNSQCQKIRSDAPLILHTQIGAGVRLSWQPVEFPQMRIRCVQWIRKSGLQKPECFHTLISTSPGKWDVPFEWLGEGESELRITPINNEYQTLTERLILPARNPRIEVAFERVMLNYSEKNWKRLQVVVRVPESVQPPVAVRVDWKSNSSMIEPASVEEVWPEGKLELSIPLTFVSMRGDLVTVRLKVDSDEQQDVIWYATDKYTDPDNLDGVILEIGDVQEKREFTFRHEYEFPNGDPINILLGDKPLDSVPQLGNVAGKQSVPSTWFQVRQQLFENEVVISEISRIRGLQSPSIHDADLAPAQYIMYSHEPTIRKIALIFRLKASDTAYEHLWMKLAQENAEVEKQELDNHLRNLQDSTLDRWLEAVAAGVSLDLVHQYFRNNEWKEVELSRIVNASRHIAHVEKEPLSSLVSLVIPDCQLGQRLLASADYEREITSLAPNDFESAQLARESCLAALATHWEKQFECYRGEAPIQQIGELLRESPTLAAANLRRLSSSLETSVNYIERSPVFKFEQDFLATYFHNQRRQQQRFLVAIDWIKVLCESRTIPPWPWFGIASSRDEPKKLVALWSSQRDSIVMEDWETTSCHPVLAKTLDEILEIFQAEGQKDIVEVAQQLRANADAVWLWANETNTNASNEDK